MVLSIAIAQTQIEQIKRPTITVLTTQWAFQNSVNSERSEEVSGSTDCATSAGFIGTSFPLNPVPSVEPARRKIGIQRARATPPTRQVESNVSRKSYVPSTGDYEIPAKLGQTWARKRAFRPIPALITVKESLLFSGLAQDTKAARSGGLCREPSSEVGLRRAIVDCDARP